MPKRTHIPSTPAIRGTTSPSHPSGGEGRGEGGYGAGTRGMAVGTTHSADSPLSWLRCARRPLPLKGAREGSAGIAVQGDQDRAGYAFEVVENLAVGEADHAPAAAFEFGGARGVVGFGVGMTVTIDLDHQAFGTRSEVGDEGFQHHLALKFHPDAATPEYIPKLGLNRRHFAAQSFGAGSRFDVALHARSPSPNPLPLKGERASMTQVA